MESFPGRTQHQPRYGSASGELLSSHNYDGRLCRHRALCQSCLRYTGQIANRAACTYNSVCVGVGDRATCTYNSVCVGVGDRATCTYSSVCVGVE